MSFEIVWLKTLPQSLKFRPDSISLKNISTKRAMRKLRDAYTNSRSLNPPFRRCEAVWTTAKREMEN